MTGFMKGQEEITIILGVLIEESQSRDQDRKIISKTDLQYNVGSTT